MDIVAVRGGAWPSPLGIPSPPAGPAEPSPPSPLPRAGEGWPKAGVRAKGLGVRVFAETLRAEIRRQAAAALGDGLHRLALTPGNTLTLRGGSPTGPWADLTRAIGAQYLPPQAVALFTRQIALESGNFDPDVISGRRVSRAGAEGIAQLMPSAYPHVDRLDPVASLHAAAATMRDNLLRFGGDLAKALAAYNAGAGAVQRAIAAGGGNWRAYLPSETQQYLRLLLGGDDG